MALLTIKESDKTRDVKNFCRLDKYIYNTNIIQCQLFLVSFLAFG
jgi:hypothetical protein